MKKHAFAVNLQPCKGKKTTAQAGVTVIPPAAVNLHQHQQVRGASLKLQKEQD